MSKVINIDFLFHRLCRDIRRWYEKYYFGRDIETRINIHLMVLKEKYDDKVFSLHPELRQKQVEEFLEIVQRNVDGYNGG